MGSQDALAAAVAQPAPRVTSNWIKASARSCRWLAQRYLAGDPDVDVEYTGGGCWWTNAGTAGQELSDTGDWFDLKHRVSGATAWLRRGDDEDPEGLFAALWAEFAPKLRTEMRLREQSRLVSQRVGRLSAAWLVEEALVYGDLGLGCEAAIRSVGATRSELGRKDYAEVRRIVSNALGAELMRLDQEEAASARAREIRAILATSHRGAPKKVRKFLRGRTCSCGAAAELLAPRKASAATVSCRSCFIAARYLPRRNRNRGREDDHGPRWPYGRRLVVEYRAQTTALPPPELEAGTHPMVPGNAQPGASGAETASCGVEFLDLHLSRFPPGSLSTRRRGRRLRQGPIALALLTLVVGALAVGWRAGAAFGRSGARAMPISAVDHQQFRRPAVP
jgi:hypothetical protein